MTIKELINIATGLRTDFKCESETMVDFCNTIIALAQKSCPDAISRSDMLDAVGHGMTYTSEEQEIIKRLPPV